MSTEEYVGGDFPSGDELGCLVRPGVLTPVDVFRAMANLDGRLAGHSIRTAKLSAVLGEAMGWTGNRIRTLVNGSLLHDVGRAYGRLAYLAALPRRLEPDEQSAMALHGDLGATVLSQMGMSPGIVVIARFHNRSLLDMEAAGVPDESAANAGLVRVADVADAMTDGKRPYRDPAPIGEVLELLSDGREFDPRAVAALRELCVAREFDPDGDRVVGPIALTYGLVPPMHFGFHADWAEPLATDRLLRGVEMADRVFD